MNSFEKYGLCVPEILLPKNIETKTWSVVACDQYTQNRDYWAEVEKKCDGKLSTLNLILPEVYLNDSDKAVRITKIKSMMNGYLQNGIFSAPQKEMVYVERTTGYGRTRHGLVAALDLDAYEWKPFSSALVRATEATILERIPPRMEIRRGAPLESPHIMLLANDETHSLVEAIGERIKSRGSVPIYSGDLMQGGGKIQGWAVNAQEDLAFVESALEGLYAAASENEKSPFLFAVGDGNHSLATAKSVWEEEKAKMQIRGFSEEEIVQSPVRYALVEIVNLYDSGLTFEPIHRAIFKADADSLISCVQQNLSGIVKKIYSDAELEEAVKNSGSSFGFVYKKDNLQKYVLIETQIKDLAVSRLQPVLDEYIKMQPGVSIDYIHGTQEVFRLGAKDETIGILLPPVAKDSFFATINERGPLPRKSFSMGEASEKRFYLECRALFAK